MPLLKTPALYCHLGLLVARLLSWVEPSIRVLTRECRRTPDEKPPAFLPLAPEKSCEECPVWGANTLVSIVDKDVFDSDLPIGLLLGSHVRTL